MDRRSFFKLIGIGAGSLAAAKVDLMAKSVEAVKETPPIPYKHPTMTQKSYQLNGAEYLQCFISTTATTQFVYSGHEFKNWTSK